MKATLFAASLAIAASATASYAATIEYSDTVSLTPTNWSDTLSVSQFDSALGVLNSVEVILSGFVEGDVRAESIDAAPATVKLDLSALITAGTVSIGSIVNVLPLASTTQNLSAFDGDIDFTGTSGFSSGTLTSGETASATLTGGDIAEFIGGGTVDIDLTAVGQSAGSGAGNLATIFSTQASASLRVIYDYDPQIAAVPLPAGAPLVLTGLLAFGIARRAKRKAA